MKRKCQQFKNGFWDEFQNRSNRGCVQKVVFFDVFLNNLYWMDF